MIMLKVMDNGEGEQMQVFFQLARKKNQTTVRPFKIFVRADWPEHKPRAVFNDEGQCEDVIFFTSHQISLIYDWLLDKNFYVDVESEPSQ